MTSLVLLLAVGTLGVTSSPMQRHSSTRHINSVGAGGGWGGREVAWGAACSPRRAWVSLQQDALLRCEVHAPAGTALTWYKGRTPLHRQVSGGVVGLRGTAKLFFSSVVYLDCATPGDQGHYRLEVTTPSRHLYTRSFTLNTTELSVVPGRTCMFGRDVMTLIPRVWQHARHASGRLEGDVVLPCRVQGPAATTTSWLFLGEPLSPAGDKYQVRASGDLVVRRLGPQDQGLYTCMVRNTRLPQLFDQVHTWLFVPAQGLHG